MLWKQSGLLLLRASVRQRVNISEKVTTSANEANVVPIAAVCDVVLVTSETVKPFRIFCVFVCLFSRW